MQRKQIVFAADSLEGAHKFHRVFAGVDADVAEGSSCQLNRLLAQHPGCDLVVYEAREASFEGAGALEEILVEGNAAALLVVVEESLLGLLHIPARVKSDFVVRGATPEECAARVRRLLRAPEQTPASKRVVVEDMTLDLATYQVDVAGEPLDLTYLEYALLSFLVTHPGCTYSRDALLRRVWGFDYYGGSRTVDVHVRRIRAKLGPELAQHLETVRGVGYFWSA